MRRSCPNDAPTRRTVPLTNALIRSLAVPVAQSTALTRISDHLDLVAPENGTAVGVARPGRGQAVVQPLRWRVQPARGDQTSCWAFPDTEELPASAKDRP